MDAATHRPSLSADQLVDVTEAAIHFGIETIRLTGGEPLLRPDLPELVRRISQLACPEPGGRAPGLDLALTTNGHLLAGLADSLARAGLKRVNVSLDSLRPDRFRTITGNGSPEGVLAGLRAAKQAGLSPIKVNVVVVRGLNDDEVLEIVDFAGEAGYHARFIEFMPLDGRHGWLPDAMVPVGEVKARIESRYALTPLPAGDGPGDEYLADGGPMRVTLIGAVTRPFCQRCNRLRVTADGFLRSCLFSCEELDLLPALTEPDGREALAAAFRAAIASKPAGHRIGHADFVRPLRAMSAIGG